MTTSQEKEKQSIVVSGENWHGKHHAEVLIMNRAADGRGLTVLDGAWRCPAVTRVDVHARASTS